MHRATFHVENMLGGYGPQGVLNTEEQLQNEANVGILSIQAVLE